LVANVAGDENDMICAELVHEAIAGLPTPRHDDNPRSFRDEEARDCLADSSGSARHDRRLANKSTGGHLAQCCARRWTSSERDIERFSKCLHKEGNVFLGNYKGWRQLNDPTNDPANQETAHACFRNYPQQ
jgi:hypothetical protein